MNSIVTQQRPDLWQRALALATRTTGYEYAPKLPLADGTIYACGGNNTPQPRPNKTPKQIREDLDRKIKEQEEWLDSWKNPPPGYPVENHPDRKKGETMEDLIRRRIRETEVDLEALKRKRAALALAPRVLVPEGSLEWLLHEVGHWIPATPEERTATNYGLSAEEVGHGAEREWQAWAFEEIILAPFGPAREFTAPTCRTGVGFSKAGPIASVHLRTVEQAIQKERLAMEEWRAIYGEWIQFERGLTLPSWKRGN